ncbi:MAG TPA: S-methyl-5-thioribose-1-phosphate isomerase [Opitutaceae bacterium]|jgi:methylthioribose-1-phosphate isomerase
MKVRGKAQRTIWTGSDGVSAGIIDQTSLPHGFEVVRLASAGAAAAAIRTMKVRGAPLIGATAAYGLWLALRTDPSDEGLRAAGRELMATRPTAVNLRWAVQRAQTELGQVGPAARAEAALALAERICDEDVAINTAIGQSGLPLLRALAEKGKRRVNILTHCNAGWLATVDVGTATAPIYAAHDGGIPVHVWVDETRPRNQGASLTAWELKNHGVPHTVISDNAGGHLMQHGEVDIVIVGTDRTTATGDVCNKIGTYLKALAAYDNGVPFYAAVPSPSIDWSLRDGVREIPIENRSEKEVTHIAGRLEGGLVAEVLLTPEGSAAANPAFDVTPARLVTGLITERGVAEASETGLRGLFAER